jgi:DNA-binding FadR family transcriptional regulator
MRKPISKHALRRAMERVRKEGFISWEHPVGTVVDQIWHELEKASYKAPRKKPVSRETVRTAPATEAE